jgi:hypothetical protein
VVEDVDSVAAELAIGSTIDEAYERYAGQLSHLCFGYEVDRYLAAVGAEEAEPLLKLLRKAVELAMDHPLRSPRTRVGVAITLDAASDPDQLAKLALGDEVIAVYDPLDPDGELREPTSFADELEAALAARPLDERGAPWPLTLFEVGFPGGAAAGSSEQTQRTFYQELFVALEPRVDDVAFVGLFGLHDRAAATCELEALSFGGLPEPRATARCSMGLRAESGASKLAWASVLGALSRYR